MSAALERRLARCERRSGQGKGEVGSCFYLLQPGDPDPVLPESSPPFVFLMRLQDQAAGAAGAKDAAPSAPAA